jgi:hypothetical protein
MAFAKSFRREHRASRRPGGLRRSACSEQSVSCSIFAKPNGFVPPHEPSPNGSTINEECGEWEKWNAKAAPQGFTER